MAQKNSGTIYSIERDPYGLLHMAKQDNRTVLLRKSNSDPLYSISATHKNAKGQIGHLKITKIGPQWYTLWEDEDGEPIEIIKNTPEEIIKDIFKNYKLLSNIAA